MNKIDQRIVEMSFENAKFEKGIKQSKNSLKDFTKALEQSDSNKSFSGLNKGLSGVSSSFSALEQVSIGALRRIGEAVVDLGANIVKSIAIEPITQGFQELELKMDSTKTIMASTGESLEVVNQKLNELNEYSDKTIYSFADMTQNIGKFTNAGVKLDLAVSSIQGIANAAALAGANANEASRAMYNFAQAISSGSVKLIDWKSIELANMGTVEFKQQLIDAAVAAGTLTKTTDGMYKVLSGKKGTGSIISATRNFNESLQEQWMTTEVLTSTLAKYADTTTDIGRRATQAATEVNTFSKLMDTLKESVGSGWAQTFELIFGDFDQAKKLWTGMNNALGAMIEKVSDVRNSLLKGGLGDLFGNQITGRENIIQGLKNVVISFLEVIKPISEAWDKIFPPMTVERLYKMTEMFKSFTEQLRINEKTADNIKRTFAGLFAVLDIIKEALNFVGKMALEVINVFIPLGDSVLDVTANIGDFIVGLRDAIKSSNLFAYALLAIKIGVTLLKNLLVDAYTNVKKFIKGLTESDSPIEYLLGLLGEVGVAFNKISTWVQGKFSYIITKLQEFFGLFQEKNTKGISTISTYFKSIGTTVSRYVVPALEKLKTLLSTITFEKIKSFVIGGVLIALAWQLGKAIKGFTNLTDSLSGLLNGLSKNKSSMIRNIKDLAISIGILAGSLFVLSKIPAETIYKNLLQIGIGLGEFLAALALIKVIDMIPSKSKKLSINFMSLSVSLLALIAALKLLGKLDTSVITKALPNIIILTGIMLGMQVLFGLAARISNGNKVAVSMGSVTASLLGMTAVVGILALIPTETINKGVLALAKIALVIAGIEVIMGLSARISGGNKFNASLITVTIAMAGMVGLVAVLGTLEDTTIKKGLITLSLVTGLLAAFQVLSALASKIGTGVKTSLFGMIGLATVVVALAASLAVLSMVDQDALTKAADNFMKVVIATGVLAGGTGVMISTLSKMKTNSLQIMSVLKALVPMLVAGAAIFGTMFLFFKGVQFILDDVKNISWDDMGKLAAGLLLVGAMFKSIAAMAVPLQVLGSGIGPALLGAVAIAGSVLIGVLTVVASVYIVVGAFVGLAALLDKLDASALSSGFDKLAIIGAAIGKFFGNILGGFVGGTIEQAGIGLASFFKAIEGITTADSIKTLAEAFFIMSFTKASSVPTFAKQVRYLITEMSEIDPSDIDLAIKNIIATGGIVDGLTALTKLADKIPNSGLSFASVFVGDNKLDDFAEQISNMTATFSSIKINDVNAAAETIFYIGEMVDELTVLSDFSKTLEDSGGLKQLATGNTTLNEFAKQIKSFVDILANIKTSNISSAKSNIAEINGLLDSLKTVSTINTELSPTSNKKYLASIEKLLTEAKNKISSFAKPFYDAGKELLANLKKPFYEEEESLNDIGSWVPKSMAIGINKNTKLVSAAGVYMAEALEESIRNATDIHSESTDVYTPIGKWVPKSMAIGINKNTKLVSAAGVDMTEQLEAGIKNKIGGASNEYKKQGESIPTNIASGIDSAKSWLTDKASQLGIDTGNFTIDGISTAIDSGKGIVTQGIQSLLDNLTGNTDSGSLLGDDFVQSFQDAISNATSGLGGTETAEKVKTELEKLQEYIEEEKYYGRISLRQELNEYLNIQSKYVTGSKERIKIDREVYRLQKSIYENQKQYIEDVTKAREDATEEALELETSYSKEVKNIQKEREAEYTKIVEAAEEKRKQLKEDYAEKEKEIYTNLRAEIKNVYVTYYDELSSRTDIIASSYGLFDALPEAEEVSGETLLNNLKDQVNAIEDWDKSITELAARGIGTTLIETLQDMGPSASKQIKALLSLSDDQLSEYVALYGNKYAAARTRAESELVTLKDAIPDILEDLRAESKIKMKAIKKEFDDTMVDINTEMYGDLLMLNTNTDIKLEELEKTFQENLASINTGLKEDLVTMKTSFDTSMNEIVGLTVEELQELNEQYEKQIPLINEQLDKDLDLMVKVFADNGKEVNAQVNSDLNTLAQDYKTGGTSAVTNLIQGLNQGIIESIPTTQEAAKTMVEVVINELRSMIESFKQIGIESARAYIDGLNKSGEISVTGISSEIGQVYNPNTSISSDTFAGISNDLVKANNTSIANISSGLSSNNDNKSQNGSKVIEVQYVQNNNSPKALSRLDIYRATQTQLATLKEAVGNV